jgi:hypothetical protein
MDFVLPLAYIALAVLTLVMAPEAVTLFRVGTAFSRAHLIYLRRIAVLRSPVTRESGH